MDSKPERPTPSPGDKKSTPQGGSFVWYLLALGVLLLLIVTLFTGRTEKQILWSDFVALVRAHGADDGQAHSIEVLDESTEPARRIRLANLDKVMVGPRNVTGRVDYTLLSDAMQTPPGGETPTLSGAPQTTASAGRNSVRRSPCW